MRRLTPLLLLNKNASKADTIPQQTKKPIYFINGWMIITATPYEEREKITSLEEIYKVSKVWQDVNILYCSFMKLNYPTTTSQRFRMPLKSIYRVS